MTSARKDEGEPAPRFTFFYALSILLIIGSCQKEQTPPATAFYASLPEVKLPAAQKPKKPQGKQKKKIYLTFDDGPNKGTMNVLQAVKEEQVPVTFFLVAEHAFASPWQQRVWDSLQTTHNIELCNHSESHAHNRYSSFYLDPQKVIEDFKRSEARLGLKNNVVRAPGRNTWRLDSIQFTDIKSSGATLDSLKKAGFQVLGWDLEWHFDPKTMNLSHSAADLLQKVDKMFASRKTRVPEHLVILAHDQAYTTEKDIQELVTLLRQLKTHEDYELSIVSSYPALNKPIKK